MARDFNAYDEIEDLEKYAKRGARQEARKYARGIHPLTSLIWLLSLALGILMGCGLYYLFTATDCFELEGREEYVAYVGQNLNYNEKGVRAISFGRDMTENVKVKTDLTEVADGVYLIDCSKEGEYTIEYTLDDVKYKGVTLVRRFKIVEPPDESSEVTE